MANEDYKFPVYGTQGGGLVKEVAAGVYVFVAEPNVPGLGVGDYMPKEWGLAAANEAARQEVSDFEGDLADARWLDLCSR